MAFSRSGSLSITVTQLTKTYGDFFALDSVSIDVKAGEFLTLLGPSGSGKTTLLMAIAGFNRPTSGQILFGERDVTVTPPHQREVGMVFQNYALFPHMSVFENVAYPLKLRKIGSEEKRRRANEALKTVQLSEFAERRIDQLSGGQKQRVALARAFVFGPAILLMDEPLSALDKKLREEMQIELKQLHRKLGVTTVYVTHDQREALTMSDRIAVINHGELAQVGTPREIYNSPANSFVASFIGESSVVPLERDSSNNLFYEKHKIATVPRGNKDNKWSLVIRPERLSLVTPKSKRLETKIYFKGRVCELVYQGETAIVILELPNGKQLTARMNTRAAENVDTLEEGQDLTFSVDKNDLITIPDDRS